jgi:hypothetical protein
MPWPTNTIKLLMFYERIKPQIIEAKTFLHVGFLFHTGNLIQHGKSKENKIKIHQKLFDLTRKVTRKKKLPHECFYFNKEVFLKEKKSSFMRIFLKFHKEIENFGVCIGDYVGKYSLQ